MAANTSEEDIWDSGMPVLELFIDETIPPYDTPDKQNESEISMPKLVSIQATGTSTTFLPQIVPIHVATSEKVNNDFPQQVLLPDRASQLLEDTPQKITSNGLYFQQVSSDGEDQFEDLSLQTFDDDDVGSQQDSTDYRNHTEIDVNTTTSENNDCDFQQDSSDGKKQRKSAPSKKVNDTMIDSGFQSNSSDGKSQATGASAKKNETGSAKVLAKGRNKTKSTTSEKVRDKRVSSDGKSQLKRDSSKKFSGSGFQKTSAKLTDQQKAIIPKTVKNKQDSKSQIEGDPLKKVNGSGFQILISKFPCFMCDLCSHWFVTKPDLQKHMQKSHQDKTDNIRSLVSNDSDNGYEDSFDSNNNWVVSEVDEAKEDAVGRQSFKCTKCTDTFSKKSLLVSHTKALHSNSDDHSYQVSKQTTADVNGTKDLSKLNSRTSLNEDTATESIKKTKSASSEYTSCELPTMKRNANARRNGHYQEALKKQVKKVKARRDSSDQIIKSKKSRLLDDCGIKEQHPTKAANKHQETTPTENGQVNKAKARRDSNDQIVKSKKSRGLDGCGTKEHKTTKKADISQEPKPTEDGQSKSSSLLCRYCKKQSFTKLKSLQKHISKAHQDQRYHCTLCSKTFKKNRYRKIHHDVYHTGAAFFKCGHCSEKFDNKHLLISHEMLHKEKQKECNVCGKECTCKIDKDLQQSQEKLQKGNQKEGNVCDKDCNYSKVSVDSHDRDKYPIDKYACKMCKNMYLSKAEFKKHYWKSHAEVPPVQAKKSFTKPPSSTLANKQYPQKESSAQQQTLTKPSSCTLSTEQDPQTESSSQQQTITKPSSSTLSTEQDPQTESPSQQQTFTKPSSSTLSTEQDPQTESSSQQQTITKPSSSTLSTEQDPQTESPSQQQTFTKPPSSTPFTDQDSPESSPKQTFKCTNCARYFARKSALIVHMKCHRGVNKIHRCEFCGETFIMFRELTVHRWKHTSAWPYKCIHCKKPFLQQSVFIRHMKIHTSRNKPQNCGLCGAAFYGKALLLMHRQVHAKELPYLCQHCPKQFPKLEALKKHMMGPKHKDIQVKDWGLEQCYVHKHLTQLKHGQKNKKVCKEFEQHQIEVHQNCAK